MHASYAAPVALHDEGFSMMYDVLHKTVSQNDVESAHLRAHIGGYAIWFIAT